MNEGFRYLHMGLPEDIRLRKQAGDLKGAIRLIDKRLLEEDLLEPMALCLKTQREMILRLPEDYPYTEEEALRLVQRHIPDFSEADFEAAMDDRKIGFIYLEGKKRIFGRFFESMCKSDPEFAQSAGVALKGAESAGKASDEETRMKYCMEVMRTEGSFSNRIRIRASVRMKDEVFHPGIRARVHLPIPAACEQQSEIVIEKVFPENGNISPEDAQQRTLCWEEVMQENHEFYVEYSYIHTAHYRGLTSGSEKEEVVSSHYPKEYAAYLEEEAPHIRFTPYIRELERALTKDISDPLEKARCFYDFITLQMKYTFMPGYFVLEDIAENCARNLRGDCGVFALLLLTLLRCAGIPACWQSGLAAEPDFCGAHDWIRFYIEPYGWLYADPSYGIAAVRRKDEERRRFYFGNLDPYRMVANNAFQASFTVKKDFWRADPYDNQVGEMETGERGLRYDEFTRSKEALLCEQIK